MQKSSVFLETTRGITIFTEVNYFEIKTTFPLSLIINLRVKFQFPFQ